MVNPNPARPYGVMRTWRQRNTRVVISYAGTRYDSMWQATRTAARLRAHARPGVDYWAVRLPFLV